MQIIPRHRLPRLLRAAGLEPATRAFPEALTVHRLTVREREPMPFTVGPHRKIVYPDGRVEGPFPVADRPALSRFVAQVFRELAAPQVLATVADGTFWLNNKTQAAYLDRVADARAVTRYLRQRGLTDRFQGGFCVTLARFDDILPRLAANTFAGGGDVEFAALGSRVRLTALACHHFDLHFAAPDPALLDAIAALAEQNALEADALALLELPELDALPPLWNEN